MNGSTLAAGEQLEADGYLIIPNLFSLDEVKQLKAEIRRIIAEVKGEADEAGIDPETMMRSGVYVGLAARSEIFKRAVADPRLIDVLETAMGPNIEFLSDKVVFKDASTDFGSPWHQDWPYWGGTHKWSVWVALDDATPENGTLRVIPGSHKLAMDHYDPGDGIAFSNRIREDQVDESTAVSASVEAGGAVFFHDLTIHGSHDCTVKQDRWIWIPTYRVAGADDPDYSWSVAAYVVRGSADNGQA
jgi:ectoine hydroxylase-related dioxygenase (phytanoyl-CoA dioxygenase family)